jgi:Sodium:solute symporter family
MQRTLAAKGIGDARRATFFAAFLKLLPLFIFVLPGVIAYVLAQRGALQLDDPAWIPVMDVISDRLYVYLQSVQAYISPPIAAVFLLGVLWPRANARGALAALFTGLVLGSARLVLELSEASPAGWRGGDSGNGHCPQRDPGWARRRCVALFLLRSRSNFLQTRAAAGSRDLRLPPGRALACELL